MPRHNFAPITGKFTRFSFDSALLENKLGDPTERDVLVHITKEGLDLISKGEKLPVLIYLAPFTSSGLGRANWKAFGESLPQRHERLVRHRTHEAGHFSDARLFHFTWWEQYVDSQVLGNWSTWLRTDLKQEIQSRFNCSNKFGLFGKSSGGFGSIYNALIAPDAWHAIASHSGDVGFDAVYRNDLHAAATQISQHGSIDNFITHTRETTKLSSDEFYALMICAMAASYDCTNTQDSKFGIRLPIDMHSGDIKSEVWQNWLSYDPLNLLKTYKDCLKSLDLCFIDCGNKDQYNLHFGSRLLHQKLTSLGIEHNYEEF